MFNATDTPAINGTHHCAGDTPQVIALDLVHGEAWTFFREPGIYGLASRLNLALLQQAVAEMTVHAQRETVAGHHWTELDGWDTSAVWARHATSQDLSRQEIGEQLGVIVETWGEPVGGLLIQHVDGEPQMIMLTGQTALEEKITVQNALWLLSRGGPRREVIERVELGGHPFLDDGVYDVAVVPSHSVVNDRMQDDTAQLVAQLVGQSA